MSLLPSNRWARALLLAGAPLAVAFLRAWSRPVVPEVHAAETERNKRLVKRTPALRHFAASPFLLHNSHLHTLWALATRRLPPLRVHRALVSMGDGGVMALDSSWAGGLPRVPAGRPVLVILPGLTGGSDTPYVMQLAQLAHDSGFAVIVLNNRGCGGSRLQTPRGFNAAYTGDVKRAFAHIASLTDAPIVAAGFSLGAGLLIKHLGEEGDASPLTAGVSMATSFDFSVIARNMERLPTRLTYNAALARNLTQWMRQHEPLFDDLLDMPRVYASRTAREFDARVVVPVFGYKDTEDYYADATTTTLIKHVKKPLLVVNALDDPIAAKECIPFEAVRENDNVIIATTAVGGHVGWCVGSGTGASWADRTAVQFLKAAVEEAAPSVAAQGGLRLPKSAL